jgi:hypothetical protein
MQSRRATADDAKLILKLYDLRREPVMRKARDFVNNFFPQSADEFLQLMQAWGSDQNAYLRQVLSYWDMAASLVLRGALHEELFLDSAGEMLFNFSKIQPFLGEIRERMGAPEFISSIETLVTRGKAGRAKLKVVQERVRVIIQMRKQAAKG